MGFGAAAGPALSHGLAFLLTKAKIAAADLRRTLDAVLDDRPLDPAGQNL